MESKRLIIATAALGLALGIAGCNKKSEDTTSGATPPADTTGTTGTDTTGTTGTDTTGGMGTDTTGTTGTDTTGGMGTESPPPAPAEPTPPPTTEQDKGTTDNSTDTGPSGGG